MVICSLALEAMPVYLSESFNALPPNLTTSTMRSGMRESQS
jgi:hypothetical protein